MTSYRAHETKSRTEQHSPRRMELVIAIAAILTISIVVVTIWWASSSPMLGSGGVPGARGVEFDIQQKDGNWTMAVSYSPPGFILSETTLTILDRSLSPVVTMTHVALSELTPANWDSYGVIYQKRGAETTIVVGATLLVSGAIYPAGYAYGLSYRGELVSKGNFG